MNPVLVQISFLDVLLSGENLEYADITRIPNFEILYVPGESKIHSNFKNSLKRTNYPENCA